MYLRKTVNGFVPASDEDAEACLRFKLGSVVRCDVVQQRNYQFLKKWFALVEYAFDIWGETVKPMEYQGQPVQPDFDTFRKNVTILAGYYKPVVNLKGEVRLEAVSISFARMTEEKFEKLYSKTINVILSKVLAHTGMSESELRSAVDQIMSFA